MHLDKCWPNLLRTDGNKSYSSEPYTRCWRILSVLTIESASPDFSWAQLSCSGNLTSSARNYSESHRHGWRIPIRFTFTPVPIILKNIFLSKNKRLNCLVTVKQSPCGLWWSSVSECMLGSVQWPQLKCWRFCRNFFPILNICVAQVMSCLTSWKQTSIKCTVQKIRGWSNATLFMQMFTFSGRV